MVKGGNISFARRSIDDNILALANKAMSLEDGFRNL
jgi:hypothetical protein